MIMIYIDTNIFSNVFSNHISEKDWEILEFIYDREDIKLVTSKKTKEEFSNIPDNDKEKKRHLKFLYKIISKVHYEDLIVRAPATFGNILLGNSTLGGVTTYEKSLLIQLKYIFKDTADAEHIFHAINAGCQYFLTLDKDSILKPALQNKRKLSQLAPNLEFTNLFELSNRLL